jgi:LPS-assembly protein
MRRRLFLLFLPSIYAPVSVANEALWNCAQNKDSKEWVCVGEKKPVDKASAAKAPASTVPAKEVQPTPVEAVDQSAGSGLARKAPEGARAGTARDENAQPIAAEPEIVKPQPAPAENAEIEPSAPNLPASAKIDKDTRQVSVESKPVTQSPVDSDSEKQLQTDANRPGWTCDTKAVDKKWNCKLAGADPKGQARVIESSEPGISLLTPAFDHNEEQTFSNLKSQLKYDPWLNCAAPKGKKPGFVPGKDLRDTTPLDINSDYAEIFENEIYSYVGNVEMTRADQRSVSKKASYDNVSETLDLQGSVYYNEDELALHSESASLNLASDQVKLRDALFISPTAPLRGRAKTIYRENSFLTRYKNVAYTSCRPGNQDWVVHASELKMNKATGQGAAKNAWLEFKGNPVLYSPYMSFPIDDRRLSGFLAPSFGSTRRGGLTFSAPYYWNIAPNYDATLSPRYLSNRGVVLGGNMRYLMEQSSGKVALDFLPHDSLLNKSRYFASIKNTSQLSSHISSNMDLNTVSDRDYFSDLGNALSMATYSSYLTSSANLGYVNNGVSLNGHIDNYESIGILTGQVTPTSPSTVLPLPYRRLPQVTLGLNHSFDFMPLNTSMGAEYVYFQHDTSTNAQRTNVRPSVSLPLQTASAFLTPRLSLQHTQYLYNDPKGGALAVDNASRTLPIFSTDTGLYMEKDLNFSNRSYLHTLEPRLFYLYIPRKDQSNISIFDTSLYDFSINSMFLENRFSGTDRVQDANQLTAALTTRLVDAKSGREKLNLSVGQIVYFQDRTVTLPGFPVETNQLSPFVAQMNNALTDHVSVSSGAQWDPYVKDFVRFTGGLHYLNKPDSNKPGEIFNVGYRYRRKAQILQDIIQSDVNFHWPVVNDWSAVGRWTYSLLNNSTNESFFGLEKENCCWTFRVIGRRWINSTTLIDPNTGFNATSGDAIGISQVGVFFQVELKGLSGVGEKLDQFFEKQIYGYRAPKK